MSATRRRLLAPEFVPRSQVLCVVAAGVLGALLVVVQADVLARLIAVVVEGGGTDPAGGSAGPVASAVALAAVGVARAALAWFRDGLAGRAAATLKARLRREVGRHVDRLGPSWTTRQRSGELATLLGRGTDGLDAYLVGYLPSAVTAAVLPVSIVVWLACTDLLSAVIVLVTLPMIPLFGALVGRHTKLATDRQWRELGRLGGHFMDMLAGLRTLQALGRAEEQADGVHRTAQRHRRATIGTLRIAFLSGLVLEVVATLSVALVAVPLGLRLLSGGAALPDALLVLILAPEAYLALRGAGNRFHAATEGLGIADRVFAIVDEPDGDRARVAGTGRPSGPLEIRFDRVGVMHDGRAEPSLREVSLTLVPGSRTALVGPSGAGKSSVVSVLLGLTRPTAGRVLVDGLDLAELDPGAWRGALAWLPQRPHLFATSLADNIRLARAGATDDEVRAAGAAAGIAEFVDGLPDGYDTLLGEHGQRLSTGQRRRVALARMFLRDAPVVVMDEPTAGLDGGSEAAVVDAVGRLMAGRTVLLCTHRPALLELVDDVVWFREGALVGRAPAAATLLVPGSSR